MKGIVLINETTGFPDITREKCLAMAAAHADQHVELAAWWQRTPLEVLYADSEAAAPQEEGWTLAKIVNVLSDKDALAEHTTLPNGRPVILIGAQIIQANAPAGSDWVLGPDSVSTAASHENVETAINPYVGFYSPFDADRWTAVEVADPGQGSSYKHEASGAYRSNFVGPRWYSDGAGPYDRMGLMTAAREVLPGGYVQLFTGGPSGTSSILWGADVRAGGMAQWKRDAKMKAGTRFAALAAKATGTDVVAELAELRGKLAFVQGANEDIARAHDRLLSKHEALKARVGRRGNGGIGG